MPEGIPYASSNVIAGVSPDLTYVGSQCYAYGGLFDSATSEFTILEFTTGNDVIVGEFVLNGSVLFTGDSHLGGNNAFKIKLNGLAVSTTKIDTTGTDVGMPMTNIQPMVLPPYTNVVLSAISGENSSTEQISAFFIGKVVE
jgi:hypothetical protein